MRHARGSSVSPASGVEHKSKEKAVSLPLADRSIAPSSEGHALWQEKEMDSREITVDLVQRVNRACIEGKKYAPHIEAKVARLPQLTPEEINATWAKVNGKAERNSKE